MYIAGLYHNRDRDFSYSNYMNRSRSPIEYDYRYFATNPRYKVSLINIFKIFLSCNTLG